MEFSSDRSGIRNVVDYPVHLYQQEYAVEGVEGGLQAIQEQHVRFFHQHGFLAVKQAFQQWEVQDAVAGLMYLMGGNEPNFRGIQYEPGLAAQVATVPVEEKQDAVRKLFRFVDYDARLLSLPRC